MDKTPIVITRDVNLVLSIAEAMTLADALRNAASSAEYDPTEWPIIEVAVNGYTGDTLVYTTVGAFQADVAVTDVRFGPEIG